MKALFAVASALIFSSVSVFAQVEENETVLVMEPSSKSEIFQDMRVSL